MTSGARAGRGGGLQADGEVVWVRRVMLGPSAGTCTDLRSQPQPSTAFMMPVSKEEISYSKIYSNHQIISHLLILYSSVIRKLCLKFGLNTKTDIKIVERVAEPADKL